MKELSIEDKAKRYDELKVKAQELTEDGYIDKLALLDLFPELKESEDERMRKELISFFTERAKYTEDSTFNGLSSKDILAWLEKQGEQKQPKELTNSEFVEKCKGLSRLEQHILALVPTRPIDAIKVDARTIRYLVAQEQGEQKLTPIFRIGDTIIAKDGTYMEKEPFHIDWIGDDCYWDSENTILVCNQDEFEIFEQKPANKVEPKFKIGDKVHLINGSSPNYEDDCIVISDISNNTYYGNWEGGYFAIKDQDKYELVEQKPAWSEEDIEMINWLIRCCEKEHEELCNDRYGHQDIVSDLKRDCRKKWDWLESLKSRLSKDKE